MAGGTGIGVMTTYNVVASDDKVGIVTTLSFQCICIRLVLHRSPYVQSNVDLLSQCRNFHCSEIC